MRYGFFGFLLAFAAPACGGSKDDVALSAVIHNQELEVRSLALGDQLSGGFDLVLEVGDYAAESTEVTLGGFALLRGEDSVLVDRLPVAADPPFPLDVPIGGSETVRVTLDTTGPLLESGESAAICEGSVWLRGVLTDSLSGGKTTTASSATFEPVCP